MGQTWHTTSGLSSMVEKHGESFFGTPCLCGENGGHDPVPSAYQDENVKTDTAEEEVGTLSRRVEANKLAMGALERLAAILPTFALTSRNGQAGDQHPEYSMPVIGYAPNWFTMIVNQAATEAGLPRGRRNAHMLQPSHPGRGLGPGSQPPPRARQHRHDPPIYGRLGGG